MENHMLKKFAYMILALSAAAFAGNGHELVIAEPYPDETGEVKVAKATYVDGLVEKGETVKLLVQPKTGYVWIPSGLSVCLYRTRWN